MALSGSFQNSIVSGHYTLKVQWSATQSVTNNTSTITAKIYLINDWSLNIAGRRDNTIAIDGKSYSYDTSAISTTGTHLLATITSDPIAHSSAGTKSVSISCSFRISANISSTYYETISTSATVTLDTITRASQPSCVTWPEHTSDVGYFGDTISVHMNRQSSNFTHTVRYQVSHDGTTTSGTIATNVGTGTTWTIPLSLMSCFLYVTYGMITIYADTYNGSTKIGTKACAIKVKIPTDVKPTVTFTLEDITKVDEIYGSPVKGLSQIQVTVNAKQAYSSPIASISTTIDGQKYSDASFTSPVLKNSGKSTVSTTVKDGRGRYGVYSYDMNVQDYSSPTITGFSVRRCDADGTANDRGEYINVTFSAVASSMNSKNTVTYKLEYKKKTATSYTVKSIAELANNYSVSNHSIIIAADGSSPYDVRLTVTDRHKNAVKSASVSTAFTMMNFNAKGNGMGIGMVNTKENTLQIGLDVEFVGKVTGAIFDAIYPVGSIYLAYNHTNPATLFGGTWVRLENAFLWAVDSKGTIGQTGGEKTHTLTEAELPAHSHGSVYSQHANGTKDKAWYTTAGSSVAYGAVSTGGGEAHNNMPPYIQVSAWRRTA